MKTHDDFVRFFGYWKPGIAPIAPVHHAPGRAFDDAHAEGRLRACLRVCSRKHRCPFGNCDIKASSMNAPFGGGVAIAPTLH